MILVSVNYEFGLNLTMWSIDTEVKRQIWKDNQSLFGDEVSPLLSQYITEKENVLFDHQNLSTQFFGPSPKVQILAQKSKAPSLFIFLKTGASTRGSGTKTSPHDWQQCKAVRHGSSVSSHLVSAHSYSALLHAKSRTVDGSA